MKVSFFFGTKKGKCRCFGCVCIAIFGSGYTIHICFIYDMYIMGIVKISDELHEELRKASSVMSRSINSQAEFWIKMGMLAELNPQLTFNQLVSHLMTSAEVDVPVVSEMRGESNER